MKSFVLIRRESNGERKVWAGKTILLFQCLMKEKIEGQELAILPYIEFVPSLDEVDKALGCVCLQYATAGSAQKGHVVEKN